MLDANIVWNIYYADDENIYITTFTQNGMVKRTMLSEFKASRYTKPMPYMKLKDGDLIIVTGGFPLGKSRTTNYIRIVEI